MNNEEGGAGARSAQYLTPLNPLSVRSSVRPSVRPSVCPFVRLAMSLLGPNFCPHDVVKTLPFKKRWRDCTLYIFPDWDISNTVLR